MLLETKSIYPLDTDVNTYQDDKTLSNPSYSSRFLFSLGLRFEKNGLDRFNVWVITISPKDSVLNNLSVKELDRKVKSVIDKFLLLNFVLFPEISSNNRYHYHGLVWCEKKASMDYTIMLKYLNRLIGNTYSQVSTFTLNDYTAYNQKKKTTQKTNIKNIIEYITKQVNYIELINYLNADHAAHNKIMLNKSFKTIKTTSILTNLDSNIANWYMENINNNIEMDEFSSVI